MDERATLGGPRLAGAALGLAVLGAAVLPGSRLGLGAAVVVLAIVALGVQRPAARWGALSLALSLALAVVPVVRAAGWVAWPCLVLALVQGGLAGAPATGWAGVRRAAGAVIARQVPGLRLLAGLLAPRRERVRALGPVLRGVALAAAGLFVFGTLFAAADAAFAELADGLLTPDVPLDRPLERLVLLLLVPGAVGALVLARRGVDEGEGGRAPDRRTRTRSEWAIPLLALVLLFGAFVALQAAALFGGGAFVARTAGLSVADHAREGFGQLVVASGLVFAVIGLARRHVRDERLLRALLGTLVVLTVVILASAWRRLDLYQDAFGATRLRLAAEAGILGLGALHGLVLAALLRPRAPWLPRATFALAGVAALAFAASDPDRRIAAQQLARGADADWYYLSSLSSDALPAVPPGPLRQELIVAASEPSGLVGWRF